MAVNVKFLASMFLRLAIAVRAILQLCLWDHLLMPKHFGFFPIEISDEDNSVAAMYQAVGELPQANRDTLAFLMIHLQRYVQMDW